MKYFIIIDNKEQGPFAGSKLVYLAKNGKLSYFDLVRKENSNNWYMVKDVQELTNEIPVAVSKTKKYLIFWIILFFFSLIAYTTFIKW